MLRETRIIWLALLLAVAGADANEEVSGSGYAASARPPVTNAPPADYVADENAHDPGTGTELDSVVDYELRQGAVFDNKQRWRNTDFIRWTVNGATLVAEGQVHDADPAQATILSSEAWGAQIVVVEVSPAEGEHGQIAAENEISFDFNFLVTGAIGEASVQLDGTAYDIKGKGHVFHLSHQQGESVERRDRHTSGTKSSEYGKLSARFANRPQGTDDSIGAEIGVSEEEYDELEVTITTRQPAADGNNGGSPTVVLQDVVTGATPLRKKYEVYSDGSVVLRARAGATAEGGPASLTVRLEKFRVLNSLRVWKSATYPYVDPPWGEPHDRRTTTPGDEDLVNHNGKPWHIPIWPHNWARGEARRAHGVAGEGGSLPGTLRVRLQAPAPRELRFAVVPDPEGSLDVEETLEIPAGRRGGSLPFRPREAGAARVFLHVLDADGTVTDTVLPLDVVGRSTAETVAPRLWAGAPGVSWRPGGDIALRARPGLDPGPLAVGRTGFAGFEETATVVHVEVEDDDGVLGPLPPTVTIPAGEAHVALPLPLTDAEGDARILLRAGAEEIAVAVSSRAQSWRAPGAARVPLGASAPVPFLLGQRERVARTVRVAADNALIAAPGGDLLLRPGERAWHARVQGRTLGTTNLRLSSPGLPDLVVPVQVVPATVTLDDGALHIAGLDASREGRLEIHAPPGVVMARATPPLDSAEYLEIAGVKTSSVTLTFLPHPDMPASLSLPLEWEGSFDGVAEFEVWDRLHGPGDDARFFLEVR